MRAAYLLLLLTIGCSKDDDSPAAARDAGADAASDTGSDVRVEDGAKADVDDVAVDAAMTDPCAVDACAAAFVEAWKESLSCFSHYSVCVTGELPTECGAQNPDGSCTWPDGRVESSGSERRMLDGAGASCVTIVATSAGDEYRFPSGAVFTVTFTGKTAAKVTCKDSDGSLQADCIPNTRICCGVGTPPPCK